LRYITKGITTLGGLNWRPAGLYWQHRLIIGRRAGVSATAYFLLLVFAAMKYLMILVNLAVLLAATSVRAQQPATLQAATAPVAAPASAPNELECRVLTGRVTDPFAYPLTGATIMLRNPDKGFSPEAFSTNAEGHYMVTTKQAILRNTIMEITAVGYATLELPLTNCRPLDLTMMPLAGIKYKTKSRSKKPQSNSKMR
jgi:hypothetical protein